MLDEIPFEENVLTYFYWIDRLWNLKLTVIIIIIIIIINIITNIKFATC